MLPESRFNETGFFAAFWTAQGEWSQTTFGTDAERGPLGAIRHLQKEAKEVEAKPDDIEEYVDCFFLTLDAARRAGFSRQQFQIAVWHKLEKNMLRHWPAPTSGDDAIEHVRGIHD